MSEENIYPLGTYTDINYGQPPYELIRDNAVPIAVYQWHEVRI